MAEEKKGNAALGYGIIAIIYPFVLAIYFCFYMFTYYSLIFGFIIAVLFYGILDFLFDDWKAKLVRFLFLIGGILTFYLILTYKYTPNGYEYFSYAIDEYIHIVKYKSLDKFFSYPFTHISLKGLSPYELNELGLGTFLSALFFVIVHRIFFKRNNAIKDLKEGKKVDVYNKTILDKHFNKIDIKTNALAISYQDRGIRAINDDALNRMLLAMGTTGAGKTIFFRNLYARNILKGNATIIIDGKPDAKNISFLQELAEKNKVPFYGFNHI